MVRRRSPQERVHLLFVGGDFERKGGDLLLDVFRRRLRDSCELHVVTRDDVKEEPGVHVYRNLEPIDPRLQGLYARCDVFVLPTQADCFSLASMEAMATGLPVVTSDVGGIAEIVSEGCSGFLTTPGDGRSLARRLEALVRDPRLRLELGMQGRRIVETRFDAARNTARQLDLIIEACRRRDAEAIAGAAN
jgi:glycosyltransferase involved in cell wall biosynthesis